MSRFFNRNEFTDGRNANSPVIDRQCGLAKEEDIPVACLYYDFLAQ